MRGFLRQSSIGHRAGGCQAFQSLKFDGKPLWPTGLLLAPGLEAIRIAIAMIIETTVIATVIITIIVIVIVLVIVIVVLIVIAIIVIVIVS